MHVKLFHSKGPQTGFHEKLHVKRGKRVGPNFYTLIPILSLEQEIERWLAQNPAIEIREIHQSVASGWFGRLQCVVTVWYKLPKVMLTREAAEKLVLCDRSIGSGHYVHYGGA